MPPQPSTDGSHSNEESYADGVVGFASTAIVG